MKLKSDSPPVVRERLTTRIGKIARLPNEVREQLNHWLAQFVTGSVRRVAVGLWRRPDHKTELK